jgi:hypothetical protein
MARRLLAEGTHFSLSFFLKIADICSRFAFGLFSGALPQGKRRASKQ